MLTRTKLFCGLTMGIAGSFCVFASSASAWHFLEVTSTTQVYVDGVGETAKDRLAAFSQCLDKSLERGEYETKREFEERKRNAQTDCESLRRFESYLENKVSLKYNADDFYFMFPIVKGDLNVPERRFDHGRILIAYNFYNQTCLPASEYRRGVQRIESGSEFRGLETHEFYTEGDCPSFTFSVDNNFFSGGRVLLPVQVKYGYVKCSCLEKAWRKCKKRLCDPQPNLGPTDIPVPFALQVDAPIEQARALKAMEGSLRLRLEGEFMSWRNKKGYFFVMQRVLLINLENEAVLFSVRGGG